MRKYPCTPNPSVVDRRLVFIGSMNMDHRSKLLNTEMGIIVDSPKLASAVADFFRDGHAARPTPMPWRWPIATTGPTLGRDPVAQRRGRQAGRAGFRAGVGLLEKAEVLLYKMLPIDGLL